MQYHRRINFLENTNNLSYKFQTKVWDETINDSHGTYNTNSQIKFETTILKSSLCDYSNT